MESETLLTVFRIVAGIAVIGLFGVLSFRRAWWLYKLTGTARPPERNIRTAFKANLNHAISNIFGNEKLLRGRCRASPTSG
jgi:hypothetical protein